jgi:hypothetical protein
MRGSMLSVCVMTFVLAIVAYGMAMAPKPADDVVVVSGTVHASEPLFEAQGK